MNISQLLAIGCALALLVTACGHPGTNPGDMSAAEHRKAAEAHERASDAHADKYEPGALAANPDSLELYNPTERHNTLAGRLAAIAQQHRDAAAALEAFEHQSCGALPPATRGLCPLLGQLASVSEIDAGVRLHFVAGVNVEAALALMQCHLAFAATQGRAGMDACPLYVEGVVAALGPDGTVELTATSTRIPELRARAATHVPH
jgi:hypothetical protein